LKQENKPTMEQVEKGKTAKYLRDKQGISNQAKENLKAFNQIKKQLLEALETEDLTIDQLTQKVGIAKSDIVYHVMSLVKYGFIKVGAIDDMDEYYTYKLNK